MPRGGGRSASSAPRSAPKASSGSRSSAKSSTRGPGAKGTKSGSKSASKSGRKTGTRNSGSRRSSTKTGGRRAKVTYLSFAGLNITPFTYSIGSLSISNTAETFDINENTLVNNIENDERSRSNSDVNDHSSDSDEGSECCSEGSDNEEFDTHDDVAQFKQYVSLPDCCVCLTSAISTTLVHSASATGHLCCCYECALQLKASNASCPMCRQPIDSILKTFVE